MSKRGGSNRIGGLDLLYFYQSVWYSRHETNQTTLLFNGFHLFLPIVFFIKNLIPHPFFCYFEDLVPSLRKGRFPLCIGSHRSAISTYYEYIDGKPVGQHWKVCASLKNVFNKGTIKQHMFIWDVHTALWCTKSDWETSEVVFMKLVMLMA